MINTMKLSQAKDVVLKTHKELDSIIGSEEGQALVEHSLLIGSITGSFAIVRDHPYLIIALGILLLILLLFWKPKLFATLIFMAILVAIIVFIYRWVEYGHI